MKSYGKLKIFREGNNKTLTITASIRYLWHVRHVITRNPKSANEKKQKTANGLYFIYVIETHLRSSCVMDNL
jgi:hypothetical protein